MGRVSGILNFEAFPGPASTKNIPVRTIKVQLYLTQNIQNARRNVSSCPRSQKLTLLRLNFEAVSYNIL